MTGWRRNVLSLDGRPLVVVTFSSATVMAPDCPRQMTHTQIMARSAPVPALAALVTVIAVTVGSACSPPGGDQTGVDQTGAEPEHRTEVGPLNHHSTTVDGLERTWSTYSPGASHEPLAPVVLVLHGTGDTGAGIRGGIGPDLERLADEHGFTIAYVDGYENNWNECRRQGQWPAKERDLDDVGLMREIVGSLGASGPVYAVGFSSGGHMTMRLALEAPDLVDGVAAVAANPPAADNQACDDVGEPVPIMFVQRREDPVNPVEGGEVRVGTGVFGSSRGEVLSAVDGARWFAERGRPRSGPVPVTARENDAETTTWEGAAPVRLVVVDRVSHSFPTVSGRWGRDGGASYDAPGEIWRFLSDV